MAGMAHFCLQKLHILPSVFLNLDEQEKAFVIASIQLKIEADKKAAEKVKNM